MGEIKGKDIFDQSAVQAPLMFAKNMDKALNKVDVFIKKMKGIEAATSKAPSTKGVDKENNKRKKQLTDLQKVEIQLQKTRQRGTQEFIKQKAALDRANKANRERTKTLNETIELEKKQLGTLERLSLTNKKLIKERQSLNLQTQKGQKRLKDINSTLDKNNKAIQKNVSGLEKQKINIGNYGSAISGLPGPLGGAARAMQGLTKASLAFIATPIGAIVAALSIAVGTLTSFFTGSEEGQNEWNKITAAASVIFGNFKDIIIDLGKGLFKLINLDFAGAKEAFNDAADGVKNFADESKRELKLQLELSNLRAKNIVLLREARLFEAKSLTKIAELREESAKFEETDAARSVQLIKQAISLQDQIAAKKEEVLQNDFRIAREEAKLSESDTATKNAVNDAEIAIENVRRQNHKANTTRQKELNTLEKKAATQARIAAKENVEVVKKALIDIEALQPDTETQLDLWVPDSDDLQKRIDKNIELYKEGQKKIDEINKEAEDQRKEDRDSLIEASIATSKQIFADFTQLRIQQIAQELEFVEFARDRELETVKGNKRAETEVNKKFDAQRRELERKQVQTEKANALFKIAINTAVAVTKITAEAALLSPLLIPLIIASGLAQAALVVAAPIPQLDKGTDNTPADYIAGEKRPELRKSSGKWSLVDKPTLFSSSPGDTIVGGHETNEILGTIDDLKSPNLLSSIASDLKERKAKSSRELLNEFKRGNQELIRTIKNKPTANISVQRDRTDVVERFGNVTRNRLDSYYRGKV